MNTISIARGAIVLLVSLVMGERIVAVPTWKSISAVIYLAIFGLLVGFGAYMYLLHRVRPALAMSYAYVNPVFAVALGVWFAGEKISLVEIVAMLVIVTGVILVAGIQRRH